MIIFLLAYLAGIVYCSLAEFLLHRFVMHRKTLVPFPYELHAVGHHGMFGADATYHALDENMKSHVTFVPRDYAILLGIHAPFVMAAEQLVGIPFVGLGAALAILSYLLAFDWLHWSFHVPAGRFYENFRWFRWIKRHHRLHHANPDRNLNVVLPLADLLFRTLRTSEEKALAERAD